MNEIAIAIAAVIAGLLIYRGIAAVAKARRKPPHADLKAPLQAAASGGAKMTCCGNPSWVAELDVGAARGFDMMLGKCASCGTPWMNVFCVAASKGGYEPVKPADVEAIRAIRDPHELKQFMRGWVEYLA